MTPVPVALLLLALGTPNAGTATEPAPDAVVGGTPVGAARVIGGSVSVPGQWPSVVALVRAGSGSSADRQFCGATVIAPRWLMTAAHCLYDAFRRQVEPSDVRAVAGVTDLRAERTRESIVTSLFIHPGYDHVAQDAYDDIALIELANALDVPAVPLFAGDTEALGPARGVVVGWGATEFTTPSRATYPDALHHAAVPLVSRAVCNDPSSYAGYVGSGQLCAGFPEGGVDSCVGDSGGPLFVGVGGRVEQVGVVSYGRGCAEPSFYGIYTSVAAYRGWIADYVELPVTTASAPADVDRPRGPVTSGAPTSAPVARPEDDPSVPGDTPPGSVGLSSGGGNPFGGATGGPWLLALLGAAIVRRRAVAARRTTPPPGS